MLAPNLVSLGSVCLKCEEHQDVKVWPRVLCPLEIDFTLPPSSFHVALKNAKALQFAAVVLAQGDMFSDW